MVLVNTLGYRPCNRYLIFNKLVQAADKCCSLSNIYNPFIKRDMFLYICTRYQCISNSYAFIYRSSRYASFFRLNAIYLYLANTSFILFIIAWLLELLSYMAYYHVTRHMVSKPSRFINFTDKWFPLLWYADMIMMLILSIQIFAIPVLCVFVKEKDL